MMNVLALLLVTAIWAPPGRASSLFTRQKGLSPSFYDPKISPGEDYIDVNDDFDDDGVDIDVSGHNYNMFGTTFTDLRCFDIGYCECGTSALMTTVGTYIPAPSPVGSGLDLSGRCLIVPSIYGADNSDPIGFRYHIAYRQVNSAGSDFDRVSEEVNMMLHQYPGTWTPTNVLIITWKVEKRSDNTKLDHFQVIITSSDDGTTYVLLLYGTLTGLAGMMQPRGFVTYDGSEFARVCGDLNMAYNAVFLSDTDFLTESNYKCSNPGTYLFTTKDATGICVDPSSDCTGSTEPNCIDPFIPQDTCTENVFCSVNGAGTIATLNGYMKWYKFARLQAINYNTFIGMGTEADPSGEADFETGATCGADLPNPSTDADFDSFSVDVTLASPECGFEVDTGAGTIKYAFKNYAGDGTGGPSDVNAPFEQAGDVIFYGTCSYNDLSRSVSQSQMFGDFSAPTMVAPRIRSLDFKIVSSADKASAVEITESEIGQLVWLQICFHPGTPFNLRVDPHGVWVSSCKASNNGAFPADILGSYERTVTFISGGCALPAEIIGPISVEEGFVVDPSYSTPGGEWCIVAGPLSMARWNLADAGSVVSVVFFQCVVEFCDVTTDVRCSDSCQPAPISRRRRSTEYPSERVYASLNVTYLEEKPDCVSSSIAVSTVAALNVMIVLAVGICTLILYKMRTVRRRSKKMAK